MALTIPPSAKTFELLSRQEALIKSERKQPRVDCYAPFYKSTKQIKQEKYDLRHKKNFLRVLKMHTVMPKILARATEPPKIFTKDYSVDVEATTQAVLERVRGELGITQGSSEVDSSSDFPDEPRSPLKPPKSHKAAKSVTTVFNSDALKKKKRHVKPIWAVEREKSAAVVAKKKVMERLKRQIDTIPLGALVKFDKKASQQIYKLEHGKDPDALVRQSKLGLKILGRLDKVATTDLKEIRQKFGASHDTGNVSGAVKSKLLGVARAKEIAEHASKARPCDSIVVKKVPAKQQPVGHSYLVKMSFEQLPAHLQTSVLENKKDHLASSKALSSVSASQRSFAEQRSQSMMSMMTLGQKVSKQPYAGSAASIIKPGLAVASSTLEQRGRLQRNMQVGFVQSINKSIEEEQQKQGQPRRTLAVNLSKTITLTQSKWQKESTQTTADQTATQATQDATQQPNQNTTTSTTGEEPKPEKSFNLGSMLKQISESKNLHQNRKTVITLKPNMGLFNLLKPSAQRDQARPDPYSQVQVKGKLGQNLAKAIGSCNSSSVSRVQSATLSKSMNRSRHRRPISESVSNISGTQMYLLNRRMSERLIKQRVGTMPLRQEIQDDQVPVKIDQDCYLVKKDFFYERPKEYNVDFARPAVYRQGCLTCGNENVVVEHYGERHCCQTCQKSLQTPGGDSVSLRASFDGRFIIAQAWKFSRPLKNVKVDIDDLRIRGGHKCHATFAGEKGDIIVLLDEVNEGYIYR